MSIRYFLSVGAPRQTFSELLHPKSQRSGDGKLQCGLFWHWQLSHNNSWLIVQSHRDHLIGLCRVDGCKVGRFAKPPPQNSPSNMTNCPTTPACYTCILD